MNYITILAIFILASCGQTDNNEVRYSELNNGVYRGYIESKGFSSFIRCKDNDLITTRNCICAFPYGKIDYPVKTEERDNGYLCECAIEAEAVKINITCQKV